MIRYPPLIHIDRVLSDAMAPTENANDAAQNAGNEPASQGPPADLPDVVPDFVGDLLDNISAGVAGQGETISDLASSTNPAEIAVVAADVASVIPL